MPGGAAWTKSARGPKVPSSVDSFPAPAFSGPDTNSQNGSKSVKAARVGEYSCAAV
ncbi:Uncharacterised protein [Mycobacteroides abscessus subsp. abscessus]|nr:Uncharacterised protein [Mycobacteroides abscessus subsp. abscessus]